MPLGLLALVALGVHAAADVVDDWLLRGVDAVDSVFDGVVGRWSLTESWVDWMALEERTAIARGVALLWELAALWVLGRTVLGYREKHAAKKDPLRALRSAAPPTLKILIARMRERPTVLRWSRPAEMAFIVLAGACAVARLIQGGVYLSGRGLVGEGVADVSARVLALTVLVGILVTLGRRAVRCSAEEADALSESFEKKRQAVFTGLAGSLIVMPLALVAAFEASPVLSFFR